MRTIKFRGQRTDTKELVYGHLAILKGVFYIVVDNEAIVDMSSEGKLFSLIMVKPETVGQFTGLNDANGNPIYEGDIVNMHTKRYGDEIFRIAYEDSHLGAFSLCTDDVYSRFVCIFGKDYGYEPYYCEVIGNIHDNPELLKNNY